jgi:DNA-binding LacI/PurR family transcriptional regulator
MKKLAVALLMAVCLVKAAHAADNDKRTYIFAGIPVVVIEANLPDSGAMSFIGLDNYQAGADTAKELIKLGGD